MSSPTSDGKKSKGKLKEEFLGGWDIKAIHYYFNILTCYSGDFVSRQSQSQLA